MGKREYSAHQQNIIKRYYENIDTVMLQKLQELVTELYLAETPTQRDRLWERVEKAMAKLKIPVKIADHIMAKRSAEVLARNVEEWLKK